MSFNVISKIVWARKLTFLLVFALIAASAVALTLLVTPIFQSEALLMTTLDRALRQQTQFPELLRYQLNSQIYIINSEDVLREAISEFGPQKLYPDQKKSFSWEALNALSPNLAAIVSSTGFALSAHPDEGRSEVDRALLKVKKRLAVNLEKDSQILSLTFRHRDPKVAEQFLSLVVRDFLRRQADLSGNAQAPAFFHQEAARYRDEYKKASAELSDFSQQHSIYSVSQEIELALARRDNTLAALAKTRGSVAEKEAQAATFQNTLTQLRRRISLPGEIIGPKQNTPAGIGGKGNSNDALTDSNKVPANESPLLLVKVFQDTAQSLVSLNSEIIGLKALGKSQTEALSDVENKLGSLSSISSEYRRLNDQLTQVSKLLEAHVGRAADAQMNANWDASEKLSNVKIIQSATIPTEPVFPPKPLFIALGAMIGLVGGVATCVLIEAGSSWRRQAYERRRNFSDGRYQDWAASEDDNWPETSDRGLRERWVREPPGPIPTTQEVASYSHYR